MKKIKIEDYIFLIIIILILLGGLIKPILKPREINAVENRTAYMLPNFQIEKFLNNTFQDEYEKALSDQIPLSNTMKKLDRNKSTLVKKLFINIMEKNEYYLLGSTIYSFNNTLVYKNYDSSINENIRIKTESLNKTKEKLKDIDMYVYYIESDKDIDFKTNKKVNAYETLIENLNPDIKTKKFEINNLSEFKKYYYETDHHWNQVGSSKGYEEIIKFISKETPKKYKETICLKSNLQGSKAVSIGGTMVFKEQPCINYYETSKKDIYIYDEKIENYGEKEKFIISNPKQTRYGDIYGWDKGLIKFDNNNPTKEDIVVIGESFDNTIIELISEHFNITYSIDVRHYKDENGNKFNITEFAKNNNVDKILLIGKIDFLIDKEHSFNN